MDNKKKILKSSFWLTASFIFNKLSQVISQIILARILGPEAFGIWALVTGVTSLTNIFSERSTAIVLIQEGIENRNLVNTVYSLGVNISIGMFIFMVAVSFPISNFYADNATLQTFEEPLLAYLILIVAFKFLINAGTGSRSAILQRQMRFGQISFVTVFSGLARFLTVVACAIFGLGVWSFAFGELVAALTDAVCKWKFCTYEFTYLTILNKEYIRKVWKFTSGLIGTNLAVYANTVGDNLIIGKLLNTRLLGFYNLGYQVAMFPAFTLSQVNKVNFSVLSRKDHDEKKKYLINIIEYYTLLYAPLYSIAFVVAPILIPILYGSEWTPAVVPFQVVLFYAYTRGFMSMLGTTLNSLNKPRVNAAINWALVPLSIPSYWVGAKLGGITGVSISVALVMGFGASLWFFIAVSRISKWSFLELITPTILPTLTVVFCSVFVYITTNFLGTMQKFLVQPLLILALYAISINILTKGEAIKKILAILIPMLSRSNKNG